MINTKNKDALYFVTEQACCLAQAQGRETDGFRVCQEAAEYLAHIDADAATYFLERTGAAARDLTGLEDYDIEQYAGKENDAGRAVTTLSALGRSTDTPEGVRNTLLEAADLIAAFYDLDEQGFPANMAAAQ
jgi:hypothetical protein